MKIIVIFGSHGNAGFATVARIKSMKKLRALIKAAKLLDAPANFDKTIVARGRLVKCENWDDDDANLDANPAGYITEAPRGLWSDCNFYIHQVCQLPAKAV